MSPIPTFLLLFLLVLIDIERDSIAAATSEPKVRMVSIFANSSGPFSCFDPTTWDGCVKLCKVDWATECVAAFENLAGPKYCCFYLLDALTSMTISEEPYVFPRVAIKIYYNDSTSTCPATALGNFPATGKTQYDYAIVPNGGSTEWKLEYTYPP